MRKSTQRIIDGLSSDDANVRLAAAKALVDAQIPPDSVAPALAQAVAGLEAEGPDRMMPILDAFAALGPKAVPACIRSLEEKRPLRFYALQVLSRLGPTAAPAVPALIATLDDPEAKLASRSAVRPRPDWRTSCWGGEQDRAASERRG